jgi:hypothetical protein
MRIALAALLALVPEGQEPAVALFNGKDLSGLTTWLRDSRREDPKKVFTVQDGVLRLSGEGMGYVATAQEHENYHLTVEYKWGAKTDGGKYVRNSGILVHATGPDGGAGKGAWMSSFEVQLAQGCVGDLIVIRGQDAEGKPVPMALTSDTVLGPDQKTRWQKGGTPTKWTGRQFWWSRHEAGFKELLDTRGKDDVESPLGEWTKVEVVADGSRLTVVVNGQTVNEAYDLAPAKGKILLQTEGFEILFRKFELRPLRK